MKDKEVSDEMNLEEDIESIFNNEKLSNNIRKAKLKTTIKTIIISSIVFIVVFVVGNILNAHISLKYSEKAYESNESNVKLSIPNGYISQSNDTIGFLGGKGTYKIAKTVGGKPVTLADRESTFGIIQTLNYNRFSGGGTGNSNNGWPISLWDNGYKKMRFFHPELQYKEYQNDLDNIKNIPDEKVIEMAISFDKPYKIDDMFMIGQKLETANITWLWLDEFTEENKEQFKFEIDTFDPKSAGIEEYITVGFNYYGYNNQGILKQDYNELYDELVDRLNKSPMIDHKTLYNEIMEKGKTKAEDAKILGVVVQGTKEDLQNLVGNSMIKASTFGVIVDELY